MSIASSIFMKFRSKYGSYRRYVIILITTLLLSVFFIFQDIIITYLYYHYGYYYEYIGYQYDTLIQCKWQAHRVTQPVVKNPSASTAMSWEGLISTHLKSEHSGWVIAKYPVDHGLCNRILDITSMLLLAIATNRTLWVEWEEQAQIRYNYIELVGMSSFKSLFNSSFLDNHSKPPNEILSTAFHLDDHCFLHQAAKSSDLNMYFMNRMAIRYHRYDFWGGLLLQNPYYSKTVFSGLNFTLLFPTMFQLVFRLNHPIPEPEECNWMIHYRYKLPAPTWYTPPIDEFLKCAITRGMEPKDYERTWIVTDDREKMMEHASPWALGIISTMNMPSEKESCRGPCGDRQAIEIMYKMAKCKHAVLSFGSSFGSCITSLAGINTIHRVGRYGDCHTRQYTEPIDVNTRNKFGTMMTYFYSDHDRGK